jgi:hypothetical protein
LEVEVEVLSKAIEVLELVVQVVIETLMLLKVLELILQLNQPYLSQLLQTTL